MSHFYSVFPLQASIPGIYAQVMVYVAPAICSFVCAMLALVLMRGNRSAAGRYMKLFSALGLFLVGILWLWAGFLSGLTFSPEIAPEIAAGLQGVLSSGAPEALPAGLTPEITPEIATGLPADFSSALRTRVWAGPLAAVICAAEIVLLYSILRYEPTRRESLHEEKGAMVEGGGLTRKAVEEYFHTVRPFVNPEFRLE
ncbi:MAG: hypothetical protein LBU97_02330 [Alistipes sp.]|nr:hypothetical protein [Alistipes sp.]